MWRPRLAQPFFSASTFALPSASLATPPCILSARTVATITAAEGFSPADRHLMSKNFSAPRSAPKPGFGDHVVGELQRRLRRHHRIAAMRDVGERTAMDEGGVVLQRLHEVRLHRLHEQHRHRAVGLQVARRHRALVAAVADDDVADPLLQVGDVVRQAEDRHDLRGDGDVEAGLAREAVGDAAERATISRSARSFMSMTRRQTMRRESMIERVPPVEVVVDHRREQIVRGGDGVEIAGEVEVDVLHRHDLRVAAAGRAAFHAEAGAERGLAQADRGALADAVQRVAEPDGRRRLSLAGRRRADRGDEDQLAVGPAGERSDELRRDLRLVVAVGLEALRRNAELLRRFPGSAASSRRARSRCRSSSCIVIRFLPPGAGPTAALFPHATNLTCPLGIATREALAFFR